MNTLQELGAKAAMIEKRGYVYSFDRDIYVHKKERKVFSREYIEDHDLAVLERRFGEKSNSNGSWKFYFNETPSAVVRREIELGLPGAF